MKHNFNMATIDNFLIKENGEKKVKWKELLVSLYKNPNIYLEVYNKIIDGLIDQKTLSFVQANNYEVANIMTNHISPKAGNGALLYFKTEKDAAEYLGEYHQFKNETNLNKPGLRDKEEKYYIIHYKSKILPNNAD